MLQLAIPCNNILFEKTLTGQITLFDLDFVSFILFLGGFEATPAISSQYERTLLQRKSLGPVQILQKRRSIILTALVGVIEIVPECVYHG